MKLIPDRLRRWVGRKAMAVAGLTIAPKWARHVIGSPNFAKFVIKGYKGNATVFACMTILARTFPQPRLYEWEINEDGEQVKIQNSELRALMKRPNDDQSEVDFLAMAIVYCALGGNSYILKMRNDRDEVIGFWVFSDAVMTPVAGRDTDDGLVAYYLLNIDGQQQANPYGIKRFDTGVGVAIPKTEIIHWKWMPDPQYPWKGIGALEAAYGDLETANELQNYIYSLIKNDARPPIVINFREDDEYDEDKAERLRAQWQERYGGDNRGLPAFLEYGMTVNELGFNLQELQIESLRNSPDASICMGFQVSPILVGAMVGLENSSYANYESALKAYTNQTLVPLWRTFESTMELGMVGEPNIDGDVIAFDTSTVQALQEDQGEFRKFVLSSWEKGLYTRGQALTALGEKATPADEVYRLPSNVDIIASGLIAQQAEGMESGTNTLDAQRVAGTVINLATAMNDGKIERSNALSLLTLVYGVDPQIAEVILPSGGMAQSSAVIISRPKRLPPTHDHASCKHDHLNFYHDYKNFPDGDGGAGREEADEGEYERQKEFVTQQQTLAEELSIKHEDTIQAYFDDYAARVETAVSELLKSANPSFYKAPATLEELAALEDLINRLSDGAELTNKIETVQLDVAGETWEIINSILETELAFDEGDPAVVELLSTTRSRAKNIDDSTQEQLADHLRRAYDAQFTIQEIAYGTDNIRGIADFIQETYKNRAFAIARTEVGTAQNSTTTSRYKDAGVTGVIVFDNGFDNSDPVCRTLDRTKQSLEWAENNLLQHPNCVRAFGASFED